MPHSGSIFKVPDWCSLPYVWQLLLHIRNTASEFQSTGQSQRGWPKDILLKVYSAGNTANQQSPDKIWVHKSLNASHTARCNTLPQSPRLPGPHRLGWLFRKGSTINRDWFQPTQIRRKAFWTTHVLALKSVLFTSFKQTLENFSFFSRINWKQRAFQRQKPRGWALAQRRWAKNPVHW